MNEELNLYVCLNYIEEIKAVLKDENLNDVKVIAVEANCDQCKMRKKIKNKINSIFIWQNDILENENNQMFRLCQELIAGEQLINEYVKRGYFIVTPGWVKNWKYYIEDTWGFNENTSKIFFKESAQKILLLDSGVYNDLNSSISLFSKYVGVDYEIVNIGLEHFKIYFKVIYYKWKCEEYRIQINEAKRKSSDYLMINELIFKLSRIESVENIIVKAFEILNLLTAAKKISFITINTTTKSEIHFTEKEIENIIYFKNYIYETSFNDNFYKLDYFKDVFRNSSKNGFIIKLTVDDNIFGFFEVEEVMFIEELNSYIKVSNFLGRVLSLSYVISINYSKLEKEKDDAISASKMKSRFLSNMSHEIRTPLNGIMGFMQLLEGTNIDEEQKSYLDNMKVSSELLLTLINDVLDISKIEAGKITLVKTKINLYEIIKTSMIPFFKSIEDKKIQLYLFIGDNLPMSIYGDYTKIKQVFTNVIANAVKFTLNGDIFIGVKKVKTEGKNIKIKIIISDTGIGMNEKQLQKIFLPFTQADDSSTKRFGGTGLGLTICKSLLELMSGEISVKSKVKKGTCFSIDININYDKENKNHNKEFENITIQKLKGKRILSLKLHNKEFKILEYYLKKYCLISSYSSIDCDIKEYDLIFVNEYDVDSLKKIKKKFNIPILIISNILYKYDESIIDGVIIKPYDRYDVLNTICKFI